MSCKVRKYRGSKNVFEYDIRLLLPNGDEYRERKKSPVRSRSGTERWVQQRYAKLLTEASAGKLDGKEVEEKRRTAALEEEPQATLMEKKVVPTVREFGEQFLETYVKSNNKPSEQQNKRTMLRAHVFPLLGDLRLDQVTMKEIELLKSTMLDEQKARKTTNNVLAMLGKMLRYAVDLEEIGRVPKIQLLRVPQQPFDFLKVEELERLLAAAASEREAYTAILFAAHTGARMGELLALEWDDVDLKERTVTFARSDWLGKVTGTKTGKVRTVPFTKRLRAALAAHRHLRGPRVFCRKDGSPWTKEVLRAMLPRVCRRAGLRTIKWHALRHTFASHLAMGGVYPRELQELGGWSTLGMVQRYTHLTPTRLRAAVEVLDAPVPASKKTGEES